MIHRHVMGKEGMVLALIVALGMFAIAFFIASPPTLSGDMGICLPSPNLWGLNAFWGWVANLSALFVTGIVLYAVNKEFTVVQDSDTVLTGMYAIMVASNLWVSGPLSSTGILALANLICLVVLFGCYRKRSSPQEMFLIASILAIGSMFQYAFIFMMPVYLIGALMMKCMNFKSFIAFLMGVCAPYWIGLGFGIIRIDHFTFPEMTNLFDGYATHSELFVGLANIALTAVIGIILALMNWVKLFAGNTQRRQYNMVVNVLGLATIVCVIFDANNMIAYLATMYMITSVQLANLFVLRNVYKPTRWLICLSLLYMFGFSFMVWGNWLME